MIKRLNRGILSSYKNLGECRRIFSFSFFIFLEFFLLNQTSFGLLNWKVSVTCNATMQVCHGVGNKQEDMPLRRGRGSAVSYRYKHRDRVGGGTMGRHRNRNANIQVRDTRADTQDTASWFDPQWSTRPWPFRNFLSLTRRLHIVRIYN